MTLVEMPGIWRSRPRRPSTAFRWTTGRHPIALPVPCADATVGSGSKRTDRRPLSCASGGTGPAHPPAPVAVFRPFVCGMRRAGTRATGWPAARRGTLGHRRLQCDPRLTVDRLCAGLPPACARCDDPCASRVEHSATSQRCCPLRLCAAPCSAAAGSADYAARSSLGACCRAAERCCRSRISSCLGDAARFKAGSWGGALDGEPSTCLVRQSARDAVRCPSLPRRRGGYCAGAQYSDRHGPTACPGARLATHAPSHGPQAPAQFVSSRGSGRPARLLRVRHQLCRPMVDDAPTSRR